MSIGKLGELTSFPKKATMRVGDATIGGHELAIIAGPCAVEGRAQTLALAATVGPGGARFFHGGTLRPRRAARDPRGLDEEGLEILAEVRETFGLKVVAEALDEQGIELLERHVDVIQIGARNMENSSLLLRAGRSHLPVLLKRGAAATLEEWLYAAECIIAEGNPNVVLCECGIRTFSQHARYTLDISVVPAVRSLSHLPVILDPSHATGDNYLVSSLALAGIAVGSDGFMVEIHDETLSPHCHSAQAITFGQYKKLVADVRVMQKVLAANGNGGG